MAVGKIFYWIKLKDTFMTSDKVDFLMSQKDGANYVVLYQMLCLKTINTGGELSRTLGEVIVPFDEEKIQRDCKYFSIDTIRIALELYKQLGMIYYNSDNILQIADFDNLVGKETDYAKQKRLQRTGKEPKLLSVDSSVDIVHTEIRDKRIDINNNIVQQVGRESDFVDQSVSIPTVPKPKKSKADQKINFEKIYEIYPRKEGKAKAFEKYLKWITTGIEVFGKKEVLTNREIYAAVVLYARDKEGQDKQYIQMCSTFFNKTIFEYVEKYRKSKEPK